MELKFRLLRADEIDCRISTCNQWGVGLLLYKDARCDQNILDESVGATNWQRHHTRDNANCIVSIWDSEKNQWIEKEDTGKESFTEKEKGLASDSFKRACFNWGIGRELYTAPNMFIQAKDLKTLSESEYMGKKKWICKDFFKVTDIQYENDKIVFVKIINMKTNGEIVFGTPSNEQSEQKKIEASVISEVKVKSLIARCEKDGVDIVRLQRLYHVNSFAKLNELQFRNISDNWEKIKVM